MDVSKEYIEMCKIAKEIQSLRISSHCIGDFILADGIVMVVTDYDLGEGGHTYRATHNIDDSFIHRWFIEGDESVVWLPCQDQLQEIVKQSYKVIKGSITIFYEVADWISNLGSSTMVVSTGRATQMDTWEKLWLAYVMDEVYHVKWLIY